MPIQRGSLLLSAQQALVGNIGKSVLAVSISAVDDHIRMIAWLEADASEEQEEALDIALTEILADFPTEVLGDIQFVRGAVQPLKVEGFLIFLRMDVLTTRGESSGVNDSY